jgi:hypothetical protein
MAALVSGVTIASAQNSSETRGPASNPNMSTGGAGTPANSMSNPSPQPPATSGAANPGSTKSMDEQANGTGQAVERNPDGSPGGSKANTRRGHRLRPSDRIWDAL